MIKKLLNVKWVLVSVFALAVALPSYAQDEKGKANEKKKEELVPAPNAKAEVSKTIKTDNGTITTNKDGNKVLVDDNGVEGFLNPDELSKVKSNTQQPKKD